MHLESGNFAFKWQGIQNPVSMLVGRVIFRDKSHNKYVMVPFVKAELDPAVIFGYLNINHIGVYNPKIYLEVGDESKADNKSYNSSKAIFDDMSRIKGFLRLDLLTVYNTQIMLSDKQHVDTWFIPKTLIYKQENILLGHANILHSEELVGEFNLRIEALDKNRAIASLELNKFSAAIFATLNSRLEWLANVKELFNVKLKAEYNNGGINIESQIASDPGEKLFFEMDLRAIHYDNYKGKDNITEVSLNGSLRNLKADNLKYYWPPQLGTNPRSWITKSVSKGIIKEAAVAVNIKADNITEGYIPKDSISARVMFDGVKVDYHEELPHLEQVSGRAIFDANSMSMEITEGTSKNSIIKTGLVEIPNIGSDNEIIKIRGKANGSAQDLMAFMALKNKEGASKREVKGKAETEFKVEFPLLLDLPKEDVKFYINSALNDIMIPKISESFSFTDGKLNLEGDDKAIKVKGSGSINGVASAIEGDYDFSAQRKYSSSYKIVSDLKHDDFRKLKLNALADATKGEVSSELIINDTDNIRNIEGKMEFKNAQVLIPEIGYRKPLGSELILKYQASLPFSKTNKKVEFTALNGDIAGFLEMDKNDFVEVINFSKLKFGNSDIKLDIKRPDNSSYNIVMKGKTLDFAAIIDEKKGGAEKSDYAINIETEIDEVLLKNGRRFYKVKGYAKCEISHCYIADLEAEISQNKRFSLKFVPHENRRSLSVYSNDAGTLFAALNISSQVKEGLLNIDVNFDKLPSARPAEGKFIMKDYTVMKAPILTKILTLGSLTGIINLLNDKGIDFTDLSADFTLQDHVIKLKDAKAKGSALGITLKGDINLKESNLRIDGVIVPAYTINSLLGNFPVIGELVGEGIVGFNYKVEGSISDPKTSVNPLSALTPGFLRNIFGLRGSALEAKE